ncbi:hypothetical protein H5410_040389 [Solanum commersonii]|uniref:Disease resistance R13L4/SHOC-2-like LRR domain-containing protein n=1 Tax=Solanum commersonii TaxID=4109 RepID=A0A9J5XNQ8_SOLCO|nr:hypothetical protein H5410_040389 [Solanum commersonii]
MSSNGELLVDWAGYNETDLIDCCSWNRVKCNLTTGQVIELNLTTRFGSGMVGDLMPLSFFHSSSKIGVDVGTSFSIPTAYNTSMGKKYPGLSNLRELWFEGYEINDINILSALGANSGLRNLEKLILNDNNFNSTIFSSLKIFPSLKHLNLASNEITGNIKMNDIIALSNLKYLNLWNNNIKTFGTTKALRNLSTVEYLYLGGSSLNENFLANIGQMTSLKVLSMPSGDNNGNLPNQGWCELKYIEELDFLDNNFVGTLPSCLGNLTSLRWLCLAGNYFSGNTTSHSIWRRLTSLEYLDIAYNQFDVPLSFRHFSNHTKLIYLAVGYNTIITDTEFQNWIPNFQLEFFAIEGWIYSRDNSFDGPFKLPSSCHLHLEMIDVSNNKLNGRIPENMSLAFPKLTSLNLSQNYLEVPSDVAIGSPALGYLRLSHKKLKGQIFPKYVKPRMLSFFYLNGNNFEGPLPSNVFITALFVLDASNNNFSGKIPRCIRDNTRLLQLDLSKNHLEGSIPVEICNLKRIQVLALSENRLSGLIPSCMSSLSLQHIHLERNQLGGTLEHVLFNFSSLITLDLRNNNFIGNIPHTIGLLNTLSYLLLSTNQLEGQIPNQISENDAEIRSTKYATTSTYSWLTFLHWIRLKRHYHDSQGLLSNIFLMDVETQVQFSTKRNSYTYKGSILKYMSGIDLSSNRLTGEIPVELGNMSNLPALNLSHNHLIGRIPNTFSNLQEIEGLDLSYNRLNGSIPVGLLELNSLAVFSVAYNNLSGAVPDFKAQFATFDKSNYEGNPFLCGYPLDNKCGMSPKLSNTTKINGDEESSELEDIKCFYIGLVVSYGAIFLGLAAALCFNRYWRKAWFRMIESLMFCCYYFMLDNIVTPIKNRW